MSRYYPQSYSNEEKNINHTHKFPFTWSRLNLFLQRSQIFVLVNILLWSKSCLNTTSGIHHWIWQASEKEIYVNLDSNWFLGFLNNQASLNHWNKYAFSFMGPCFKIIFKWWKFDKLFLFKLIMIPLLTKSYQYGKCTCTGMAVQVRQNTTKQWRRYNTLPFILPGILCKPLTFIII